jgi:pilus assembly protein CpaF
MSLPVSVIREQIARAVHLIVQQTRLRDGSRRVTAISEVAGMQSGQLQLRDVFRSEDAGGLLKATEHLAPLMQKLAST